jgi:hypothetical protein
MAANKVCGAAAALLGSYLEGGREAVPENVQEGSWEKLAALHQLVRGKFDATQSDYALATLAQIEEEPHNEEPQEVLAAILFEETRGDPDFGEELDNLVDEAVRDDNVSQFAGGFYDAASTSRMRIDQLRRRISG